MRDSKSSAGGQPAESAKRAAILQTAQTLFVEQSYSDVSMDMLAEAVPVSKRTLYNYFGDKKTLFIAVMQSRCRMIADSLERILLEGDGDVAQTLTRLARQFLEVVLDPQAIQLYRTAITQAPHLPDMGTLFYNSGPKRSMGLLASYFERLNAQGRWKMSDCERKAGIFFGMLSGRFQMRLLLGVDARIAPEEVEEHIGCVIGIFLDGQNS